MANWKKLAVVLGLGIMSSGCGLFSKPSVPVDIIMVGDCEHGLVSTANVADVQKIFPLAQRTDVLIAGGCYQQHIIKAK